MKRQPALCFAAAVLAGLSLHTTARAQSDDFGDGNDTGWTHYAPLQAFGSATAFTVSNGAYQISCEPSANAGQLGPARAGSIRQDAKYKTFYVSVDLKNWNAAEDTSMGILARVQNNVGLGTTSGYAFTFQGQDGDVQISRVTGEDPTDLSGTMPAGLVQGGNYRMVFFGVGEWLEGRIYEMSDPLTPLVVATARDSTYTEGTCGLVVFADANTRASATFDNYYAGNGLAPVPVLMMPGELTPLEVSWDLTTGICHTIEMSHDLVNWTSMAANLSTGGRMRYLQEGDPDLSQPSYYRLRLGPAPVAAARQRAVAQP